MIKHDRQTASYIACIYHTFLLFLIFSSYRLLPGFSIVFQYFLLSHQSVVSSITLPIRGRCYSAVGLHGELHAVCTSAVLLCRDIILGIDQNTLFVRLYPVGTHDKNLLWNQYVCISRY